MVGLGYVGLPLALELGSYFDVTGYDVDGLRVAELVAGVDRNGEMLSDQLSDSSVYFTSNARDIESLDIFIVAVPTPINAAHEPDLNALTAACRVVGKCMSAKSVIIFESTVAPGTTMGLCKTILESESGLQLGRDFGLGYSPERINPGDKVHTVRNIVKIISGDSQVTLEKLHSVYSPIIDAGLHVAPSIEVAETAKVIENVQRDVNIALMNELSVFCHLLGIDTSDVLKAAGTKWNFLKFCPGLVGGHCIGVDPFYLTHTAVKLGMNPQLILAGRSVNESVPGEVATRIVKKLLGSGIGCTAKILICGATFKENCSDIRNSKSLDLVRKLEDFGFDVDVYDPIASLPSEVSSSFNFVTELVEGKYGAVVLSVAHNRFSEGGSAMFLETLIDGGIFCDLKNIFPEVESEIRL